jgi:hypothetical protein
MKAYPSDVARLLPRHAGQKAGGRASGVRRHGLSSGQWLLPAATDNDDRSHSLLQAEWPDLLYRFPQNPLAVRAFNEVDMVAI